MHQSIQCENDLFRDQWLPVNVISEVAESRSGLLSAKCRACCLGDVVGWPHVTFEYSVGHTSNMIPERIFEGENVTLWSIIYYKLHKWLGRAIMFVLSVTYLGQLLAFSAAHEFAVPVDGLPVHASCQTDIMRQLGALNDTWITLVEIVYIAKMDPQHLSVSNWAEPRFYANKICLTNDSLSESILACAC